MNEYQKALIRADSIMSLILYRRGHVLSDQDKQDLDAAISECRRLTKTQSKSVDTHIHLDEALILKKTTWWDKFLTTGDIIVHVPANTMLEAEFTDNIPQYFGNVGTFTFSRRQP